MSCRVTLVIKADLSCCQCKQKIQDYLCRIQCKYHIEAIIYDEKINVVRVTGVFNGEELKRKLLCKLRKVITEITVVNELVNCIIQCKEEHKKIIESIETAKVECEVKCKKIIEETSKKVSAETCKKVCEETCKKGCQGNCNKGCQVKICEPVCPDPCKVPCQNKCKGESTCTFTGTCTCKVEIVPPKPPPCKEQPVATICCASPCPCFVPSCSSYRCCSCGVVGWPGSFRPGWGDGPGYCGRPSWGYETSRASSCASSGTTIILDQSPDNCSIM